MGTYLSVGLGPICSVDWLRGVVWELQCRLDLVLPDVAGSIMEQWEDRADGVAQCIEQCAGSAQGVSEFVFEDDVGG